MQIQKIRESTNKIRQSLYIKFKKYKKIFIIFLWILPPLIFGYIHLSHSGLEGKIDIAPIFNNRVIAISVTKTIPVTNSATNSTTPNFFKYDQSLNVLLNDLGRFLPIIKTEANIFRYDLLIKNDAIVKIYTDNTEKNNGFIPELSCDGKIIPFGKKVIIENNLYLGNRVNDDRNYIEETMSDCLTNLSLSLKNNTGETILIQADKNPEATGTMSFIIRPDIESSIFLFVGWLVAWSGFLILIREGIIKSLREEKHL